MNFFPICRYLLLFYMSITYKHICCIMFFQECNLYQLMKDRNKLFSEAEVKNWCFQVFQGLAYMHRHGYFHRDLKPGDY